MQESWADHMVDEEEFDDFEEPHVDPLERELAQEKKTQPPPPQQQQQQRKQEAPRIKAPPHVIQQQQQQQQHHHQQQQQQQAPPRSSPSHARRGRDHPSSSRPPYRGPPRERRTFEKKVFTDENVPQEGPYVMYVANLSFDATSRDVQELFNDTNIVDITVPYDKEKRRTKGFGYVVFEDRASFLKALDRQGADLLGRALRVDLTDKEKALVIADRAYARSKKRTSTSTTEADAITNWRSAPKRPAVRATRPIRTSTDVSTSPKSTGNAWGSKQTAETTETTPESTPTPTTVTPTTTDEQTAPEEETQRDTRPRRNGSSEYRGRGSRGGRGGRGRGGRGRGGRGGKRDSFRGGKSREQMELERDFQKLLQSDVQGGKKSKSNQKSDANMRNAFLDLAE